MSWPSSTLAPNHDTSTQNTTVGITLPADVVPNTSIPGFLLKTYNMVEESPNPEIICWNSHGDGFLVLLPHEFARDILPLKFKHNNFSSFVRQLNFYGFSKHTKDVKACEFRHPLFVRGRKDLLLLIKRKKSKHMSKVMENEPDNEHTDHEIPIDLNFYNADPLTITSEHHNSAEENPNQSVTLESLAREVRHLKRQYEEMWAMQRQFMLSFVSIIRSNGSNSVNMPGNLNMGNVNLNNMMNMMNNMNPNMSSFSPRIIPRDWDVQNPGTVAKKRKSNLHDEDSDSDGFVESPAARTMISKNPNSDNQLILFNSTNPSQMLLPNLNTPQYPNQATIPNSLIPPQISLTSPSLSSQPMNFYQPITPVDSFYSPRLMANPFTPLINSGQTSASFDAFQNSPRPPHTPPHSLPEILHLMSPSEQGNTTDTKSK